MRSCVCDARGAASIFIFCFWNQQRNDAIQSLLTEERKWHIWGPVVIPCVLWESDSRDERFAGSDYLSRAGTFLNGTHYCFKHTQYRGKNGYAQCTQYADGCLVKCRHFYVPLLCFTLFILLYEGQIKSFFTMLSSLIFKCVLLFHPWPRLWLVKYENLL